MSLKNQNLSLEMIISDLFDNNANKEEAHTSVSHQSGGEEADRQRGTHRVSASQVQEAEGWDRGTSGRGEEEG